MRFLSSILSATIAVSLLVGCSGNTATPIAPLPNVGARPLPDVGARSLLDSRSGVHERRGGAVNPAISQHIYVADYTGNDVSVYDHAGNFKYSITQGVTDPHFITFDASGNLYVVNLNTVTVYGPGQQITQSTLSAKISQPTAVAVDSTGNIYVANAGNNTVTIYGPTGDWMQTLSNKDGVELPMALALDSNGYLYVANNGAAASVTVYGGALPDLTWERTIWQNIYSPNALAFDSSGDLFVANDTSPPLGVVTKYLPYAKGSTYSQTYGKKVLDYPDALAFDQSGNLCVSSSGNNEVICFSGPSAISDTLTQKDGINAPTSIAIGPAAGWIKVANGLTPGTVTQYCPKCHTPNTITNNVSTPLSIAVGP